MLNYFLPAVAMGVFAFMMVAYNSAFTPAPVQDQKVILYKFKEGVSKETMEKHLQDFKLMKRDAHEIVDYSAGYTYDLVNQKSSFDVMHYLTFKSEQDIEKYMTSEPYKNFVKAHENLWEEVLIVNSQIK